MKSGFAAGLFMTLVASTLPAIDGYEVLHAFEPGSGLPAAGLLKASDGNFYGMTSSGGAHGDGTVFRLLPDGTTPVTIHDFDYFDGAQPLAPLVQGTDGYLYGTTYGGGFGYGTVFRMTLSGQFTTLHRFENTADGWFPEAGLVRADNGNLYGTTSSGSSFDRFYGTVFRIDGSGAYATIHAFSAGDGSFPKAALVQAPDGNLYGTTSSGGSNVQGTVFRVDLPSEAVTTLIFSFHGADGSGPKAALLPHTDGFLYGTTENGGAHGYGTVFKIDTNGTHRLLHSFELDFENGVGPTKPLIEAGGSFYGTTARGGFVNQGVVFRMDAGVVTTLHSFSGTDGGDPSGLVESEGDFYGTTPSGGAGGAGTVFRIDAAGAFETLTPFVLGQGNPVAALVEGCDGKLYGSTHNGGPGGGGTVFRLEPGGGITTIHAFGPDSAGGFHPQGSLAVGADCNLYGTTFDGGAPGYGTVFKLGPGGSFELLHTFDQPDGSHPAGGVMQADDGWLYGTTRSGGVQDLGTIFRVDTAGRFESLHSFDLPEGYDPTAPLVQASDGRLYGTTFSGAESGTLFRIDAAGAFEVLHAFTELEGRAHWGGLVEAAEGQLYGPALLGGENSQGTVYRFDISSGSVDVIHPFVGGLEGGAPASLVLADDGNLYGTSVMDEYGKVFRMSLSGSTSVRHAFTGSDGAGPVAPLLQGPDGDLYGVTSWGGQGDRGVVFRLGKGDALTISAVSPASGPASGGWRLTASGNGYLDGTTLTVGGAEASGVFLLSATQIVGETPSLSPGTLNDVTVASPAAAAGASATLTRAYFADFLDVPQDDIFHAYVESVFRSGITAGCGAGDYCPRNAVTRAQMAVFLLKARHGAAFLPPACAGTFEDVACPGAFTDWIEELAAEGITGGCGGNRYCPGNPVTRAQMAVFLLKAEHGSSHVPPPCAGVFDDVGCPSLFADWVEELAYEGVTGGCQVSPALYCPGRPSTRGQMAVFLVKTFPPIQDGPGHKVPVDSRVLGAYPARAMTRYWYSPLTGSGAACGASGSGSVR